MKVLSEKLSAISMALTRRRLAKYRYQEIGGAVFIMSSLFGLWGLVSGAVSRTGGLPISVTSASFGQMDPLLRCEISLPVELGVIEYRPSTSTIIKYGSKLGSSDPHPDITIVVDENHVSTYPIQFSRCTADKSEGNNSFSLSYKCSSWGNGLINIDLASESGLLKYFYAGDMRIGRYVLSGCKLVSERLDFAVTNSK